MKVIVAHPGKQHSFRVVKALKDAGLLYKYATTVYNKDSSLLMRVVKLFLGKDNYRRAQDRKCSSLNDDDVIQFCELEGLFLLALIRLDKSSRISKLFSAFVSRMFQRRLARFILKEDVDAVISYDTNSEILFSILKDKKPSVLRILDNAAPNRHYLYKKYHEYWDTCGPFVASLNVYKYIVNESVSQQYVNEILLANYHIVASSFSKDSITFEGVDENSVFVIPYGVDDKFFIEPKRIFSEELIKVVFIGKVNQQKGIAQVLYAAKMIHDKSVIFDIIGPGREYCRQLYEPYKELVNFNGFMLHDELIESLKSSHVFVFPTMGEGFGLVLFEAMAAGLVPITTRNCAGADIVRDGDNGFLIEVGDGIALVEKILWCKEHPKQLAQMSIKAKETAQQYTWDRYAKGIIDMVLSISKN